MKMKSNHSVYNLQYHTVWVSKYRRKVFTTEACEHFESIIHSLCHPGVIIDTIGFDSKLMDHVHMVISIPPKYAISKIIGSLKGQSSTLLLNKLPHLTSIYAAYKKNVFWSPGYFISSFGNNNKETIKEYISNQG